jgi:hypothetical protein
VIVEVEKLRFCSHGFVLPSSIPDFPARVMSWGEL